MFLWFIKIQLYKIWFCIYRYFLCCRWRGLQSTFHRKLLSVCFVFVFSWYWIENIFLPHEIPPPAKILALNNIVVCNFVVFRFFGVSGCSFQMEKQLKDSVRRCIDARKVDLHNLSRDIWSRPELGGAETCAHDRLVDLFSREGSWTVEPHYTLPTAFRATWGPVCSGEGDPVVNVALLCEYDALPGIGHACGHNLIAEVGAAAALGLKAALEQTEQPLAVKVRVNVTTAEWKCHNFPIFR